MLGEIQIPAQNVLIVTLMIVNARNKMPYIKEDLRKQLDSCIDKLTDCINTPKGLQGHMDNNEFATILGDINYCFSRIIGGLMGEVSYPKIAMITGVLENIKQEYYRRVASIYEEKKIIENGDIKEYKRLK